MLPYCWDIYQRPIGLTVRGVFLRGEWGLVGFCGQLLARGMAIYNAGAYHLLADVCTDPRRRVLHLIDIKIERGDPSQCPPSMTTPGPLGPASTAQETIDLLY